MPGKAIYTLLSTDADITAVVGNRIFPVIAKIDGRKPAIIYHTVGTRPTDFKDGPSDIDFITVQIDVYADDYGIASNLAELVRRRLDRYPHSTVSGVHLAGVSYTNGGNAWEDGDKRIRISSDYQFRIRRAL